MKKVLFILVALAVAMSFGAPAMAKQGLSAGIGFGLMGNAGNLGGTICDDGLTQNVGISSAAAGALETNVGGAAAGFTSAYGIPSGAGVIGGHMDELTLVEAEDSLRDSQKKVPFRMLRQMVR